MKFGFGSTAEKNGFPRIDRVAPAAAIPGGEIVIHGSGFASRSGARPVVHFGEAQASLVLATDNRLIARVPDNANGGIYVTFSGPRGQRVPVSLYKITSNYSVKPFVTSLINPSGLALDRNGNLFVSCRNDGTIHRVPPDGRAEQWIEGMGVATGIAFDHAENLYVGDRSGTIFKISPSREIFVFATLEPSVAAYHLVFHPSGDLYVSGPTTSSFDRIHRITQGGEVSVFFRGLGRPQGIALDRDGNLYVAASYGGRRGIVRITPQAQAEVVLSGSGIVGMALQPSGRAILATTDALFTLDWDVRGLPLIG